MASNSSIPPRGSLPPKGPQGPQGEGFGGILKGLGDLFSLVEKLKEDHGGETGGTREFTSPSGMRGVYGFSVRMGQDDSPTVEHFGNVKVSDDGAAVVSEIREPLVDVFDEGEEIVVVAEVPGVSETDIHLELTGDVLALVASGPKRKYEKEVLLPAAVDAETQKQSYQNGYLELRYRKSVGG